MSDFIFHLVIACLAIIGLNKTAQDGMIFEKLGKAIKATVGEFWSKPLISCPPCMASVYGTAYYFFVMEAPSAWPYILYPVFIFALSGLNYIVNSKLD